MDADFFVRLAQCGVEQSGVDRIDASAGECDLSAVARDVIGAPDVDDVKLAVAFEQRYQHRGGVRFVRQRLARRRSDGGKLPSMISTWGLNEDASLIATDNR